jgi:hypothetical protein
VDLPNNRFKLSFFVLCTAIVVGVLVKWVIVDAFAPIEGSACNATATGATAITAARNFVADCGSGFGIERGPYDAMKAHGSFANYAQVVEFNVSVPGDNPKGPSGFLTVGRRTRHEPWRTLAPLATGP